MRNDLYFIKLTIHTVGYYKQLVEAHPFVY